MDYPYFLQDLKQRETGYTTVNYKSKKLHNKLSERMDNASIGHRGTNCQL